MVIDQRHSIGDILFLEPMFRHFLKMNGEKPIVPLRPHLTWLSNYIDSAGFIDERSYKDTARSLDTMHANQILRGLDFNDYSDFENCMPDKYNLAGLDPLLWKNLEITFDSRRGIELFRKICPNPEIPFILVNNNCQAGKIDIKVGGLPIVEMQFIPGYTVLDWFFVITQADQFHTVSTSTFYVMQAMLNAGYHLPDEIFIHARPNEDGLRGISKLHPDFQYKPCP